jgi:hypothetical protein
LVGLENADLTLTDLQRVRSRLIREAEAIEYVQSATVKCTLLAGTLYVEATINLIDGKSYPLAVTIDGAGDALANFFRLAA